MFSQRFHLSLLEKADSIFSILSTLVTLSSLLVSLFSYLFFESSKTIFWFLFSITLTVSLISLLAIRHSLKCHIHFLCELEKYGHVQTARLILLRNKNTTYSERKYLNASNRFSACDSTFSFHLRKLDGISQDCTYQVDRKFSFTMETTKPLPGKRVERFLPWILAERNTTLKNCSIRVNNTQINLCPHPVAIEGTALCKVNQSLYQLDSGELHLQKGKKIDIVLKYSKLANFSLEDNEILFVVFPACYCQKMKSASSKLSISCDKGLLDNYSIYCNIIEHTSRQNNSTLVHLTKNCTPTQSAIDEFIAEGLTLSPDNIYVIHIDRIEYPL